MRKDEEWGRKKAGVWNGGGRSGIPEEEERRERENSSTVYSGNKKVRL